jgi:WD40 repeat protein
MTDEASMAMAFPPLSPSEPPRVFGAPTLSTESELLALGMAIDGSLWSIEEPGLMRQWNLATRRQRGQHPLDELATVWAFNWAGRLAASASNEVAIWEVYSGDQLAAWPAPAGKWVTALAFQPGAAVLASGHDDDGLVQVWHWTEKRLLREFSGHVRGVSALAFSLDRKHLAVASEDRLIHVYDLDTGAKVQTLQDHTDRIPALAWHPDGKRLFSAGWDTTVRVWDVTTGQPIILLNNHTGQVHNFALSADGRLLAAADSANAVHVWDTDRYVEVAILRSSAAEVRCLCFTPDDDKGNLRPPMLAYGGADRVIYLWDSRQGADAGETDTLLARTAVALDPAGKKLYSLGTATALRGFAVETGEDVLSLDGAPALRAFALSPDGKWLAASPLDGVREDAALSLLDASGKPAAVCEGQKAPITALAFNPRSDLLASGGVRSCDVWLWKVPSGEPALLIPDAVDDCGVEALAWRPGSDTLAVAGIDYLATGGDDGEVTLWDVAARAQLRALPGGATAVAFSPDGKLLAVANLRRTVTLYDADSGAALRELSGHQDAITCLAFSPDGRRLASGSDDRTIRLWQVATGEPAAAWELDDQVRAVTFGPEGRFIYTGNGNTSCYQIELDQLLASATV